MSRSIQFAVVAAPLATLGCSKDNKTTGTERSGVSAPTVSPVPAGSDQAAAVPAAGSAAREGYPPGFPFLDGGTIDPGYKPELMPGEVSSVLVAYPRASLVPLVADLSDAATKQGWSCSGNGANHAPVKLQCTRGTASVSVNAKDHPQGGVALFVEVP